MRLATIPLRFRAGTKRSIRIAGTTYQKRLTSKALKI
jgi:hypothetical protein